MSTAVHPEQMAMALDENGNPVIIVRDQGNKTVIRGIEAHKANIQAARSICNTLQTSLGPKGMDKILISAHGNVTITNDGATILKEMDVANEAAKILVDLATCQDDEIGDGTTGVTVLAGALLEQAEPLLDRGIHPARIAEGYEIACNIAVQRLNEIAIDLDLNRENLLTAAKTSLHSKIINRDHDHMASIAVDAVSKVITENGVDAEGNALYDVDFDKIKIKSKAGGELSDTALIDGLILTEKAFSHTQMTKRVENSKIALLNLAFEPPKPKTDYSVNISSAEQYRELYKIEQEFFQQQIEAIKAAGANVVLCQWGMDYEANHLLQQADLPTVTYVSATDLESIALACNGRIVPRFEELNADKLGEAHVVYEDPIGTQGDRVIKIEGCANTKVVTVFVRGGNNMVIAEAERSLHDAMCVVRNMYKNRRIVYGGGSCEIAASLAVAKEAEHARDSQAQGIDGIHQQALRAYADALEAIPLNLARNCGLNAISTLAKAKSEHENNNKFATSPLGDMEEKQIWETLSSKTQQLLLATQVVRMLLKVDEVIENKAPEPTLE